MSEQRMQPEQARPVGTAVLVRAVLAAVAVAAAGALLAGGLRLGRLALRVTVRALRAVWAHWLRVCGAVLVAASVAGLVATVVVPALIAVTGAW
ncbi:hypothetical protein [Actinomadura chokoriensis]|uniref:Uncharacterized protein n=1 Tax=Actinomadura chokoriensis TaxID=454156 RepID=A0ABV4R3N0_9ACTN